MNADMGRYILAACLLLPCAQEAAAQATVTAELPETIVVATPIRPTSTASEREVTPEEIAVRPISRPGEVVEVAPGLIATQHSGEGKANQYFLRGFNLDHGTDLALSLDGMPLNMRTHAHGQGYADINFLIPELLGGVLVRKGPFAADLGDFATAGALDFSLVDSLPTPIAQITGGSFGYWRGLTAGSFALGSGTMLMAGEAVRYDGPWERPDDLRKLNAVMRFSQGGREEGFSLTAMAYSGRWNATDQVPSRALTSGLIGRFGTLDASDGGMAERFSLSGQWHRDSVSGLTRANVYAVRSTLDLYNNFTYFLDDPINGDQFQQRDRRWLMGFNISHEMEGSVFDLPLRTRVGLQTRYDDIQLGLYRTRDRAWLSTVRSDAVQQASAGLWMDSTLTVNDWFRTTLGLRADQIGGRVDSDLAANSGSADAFLLSPKAGFVIGPVASTELFVNIGTGFHSNDLRGATITVDPNDPLLRLSRVPLLVRAKGGEVGLKTRWADDVESSIALFLLTLGSEIVFVGDAGTTEAGRPSRRVGVEWTNHWKILPWLGLDLDIAATQARLTDSDPAGDHIPGAPKVVAAAGLAFGENAPGWFGGARFRYFGARPLIEDNSVQSQAAGLFNMRAGYRFENGMQIRLDAFNVFGARTNQIEYYYASRLRGEAAPVSDRHLHPVEPTAIRLTLTVPL